MTQEAVLAVPSGKLTVKSFNVNERVQRVLEELWKDGLAFPVPVMADVFFSYER